MALELQEGSLKDASGLVIYPREFGNRGKAQGTFQSHSQCKMYN